MDRMNVDNGVVLDGVVYRKPVVKRKYEHEDDVLGRIDVEEFCRDFQESPTLAIRKHGMSSYMAYKIARKYCKNKRRRHKRHLMGFEKTEIVDYIRSLGRKPTWRDCMELARKYGVSPDTIYRLLKRAGLI